MIKKTLMALLLGLFMCPSSMDAKVYKVTHVESNPDSKPRTPSLYQIGVYVDAQSGDIVISPNYDITGLTVTIAQNSAVYEQTTVSLAAGQAYTTSVADYDEGDYTLTLTNSDGDVISQYTITVEED